MEATTENLAKWIDELAGDIEILRKKINNTGGDTVTITPALESGVKVADYSIGETTGTLYAPKSVNYSTAEQETGKTWIDGSPVYQKTISLGELPNASTLIVAHGISNLDTVISFDGMAFNSVDGGFPLPNVSLTLVSTQLTVWVDSTNITLQTGSDRSGYYGYMTLYYTKKPPVETKKGGKKK